MVSNAPSRDQDLIIRVPGNLQDVLRKVQDITAHTYRTFAPVHVFRQGGRTMVSAAIPINVLTNILIAEPAEKNKDLKFALEATNRPFMKDHCDTIAKYLRDALLRGENYIIPPLALNVLATADNVRIYIPEGDDPSTNGYMILPNRASIYITDGQHRFRAIEQVAKELVSKPEGSKFLDDSVPVMMTLSETRAEVHQDFADAGRTKALPPALLAAYNTRQPANKVAMQIIERTPLMTGRINYTGNSVSQSSPYIFTGHQVLQFVRHSLAGSTSTKENQFTELAETSFSNEESRERWTNARVAFLKVMTEIIPDWHEVAQLSRPEGSDSANVVQKTKDIKQRPNVTMSGALLNALGLVSHEALEDATLEENAHKSEKDWVADLEGKLKPLRGVNWSREADIWDDNIVVGKATGNPRMRTQGPAVKGAADEMLKLLKLEK